MVRHRAERPLPALIAIGALVLVLAVATHILTPDPPASPGPMAGDSLAMNPASTQ